MKKYISIFALAVLTAVGFTSCDKDTEGKTWTTYYPNLTIEGATYGQWEMGVPFEYPDFNATSAGDDITTSVKVTTDMDLTDPKPGYYAITYTVTNASGNTTSTTQYVLVADPNDPVSGYYYTNPDSYRQYNGYAYFGGSFMIIVIGNGDGTYAVSDLIGGWYAQRAGYGSNYAMQGEVAIAEDGTITMLSSYVPGWNDSATEMTNGYFDKDTQTITWDVEYTDSPFIFHVEMSK